MVASYRRLTSCPARGTWIEIGNVLGTQGGFRSCPARGTWIEIVENAGGNTGQRGSCPARGMWIEIPSLATTDDVVRVVPRKGHVD